MTRGAGVGSGKATDCSPSHGGAVMAGEDTGAHMLHQPTAALSGAAAAAVRGGGGTQHRTSHPSDPHILIIHLALSALLYPPLHPPCLLSVNPLNILHFPLRQALCGGLNGFPGCCSSSEVGSARCRKKIKHTSAVSVNGNQSERECVSVRLDLSSGKLGAAKKPDH